MAKRKILKLEYSVTLFIMLAVALLIIPFDFENTVQAGFISKWKEKYSRLEYMFKVINIHEKNDILKSFKRAQNSEQREEILINLIQPYLRIHKEKLPKRYSAKFMNNMKVPTSSRYYFEDTYFSENGAIVGIKNLEDKPNEPMFIMMVDINGLLPPNTWGKDIYGVDIFEERIEPFGAELSIDKLRENCSFTGQGTACSYYYIIGGGFND